MRYPLFQWDKNEPFLDFSGLTHSEGIVTLFNAIRAFYTRLRKIGTINHGRRIMRKLLLCLVVLMSGSGFLFAQIYVPPGEGTLTQAIAAAQDGDVLQLVPDGVYTESTAFAFGTVVNMDLTIEVEGDGSLKAIVQMLTAPSTEADPIFFDVGDQASLTLRGLEFDGALEGTPSAEFLVRMYMGEFPTQTTIKKIRIENCYIHHLNSHVIDGDESDLRYNVVVDSTFLDDVVVGYTETPIMYKDNGSNYISVKNCTFHKINRYGFRVAGPGQNGLPDNTPTVVIDHTTWYDIGIGDDQREIIQCEKGPHLNPWTITNSIFVKQVAKDRTVINIKDTVGDSNAVIASICMWDIGKISFRDHTVTDTITMDPEFADPENGDFTLPEGSLLLTYGTDGGPIGDLRWATAGTPVEEILPLPGHFALDQNYPNPFNPTTTISFHLNRSGLTRLAVYDLLGGEMATLINENMAAGEHRVVFDASRLTSGIYFYRLQSAGQSIVKKMMLLK